MRNLFISKLTQYEVDASYQVFSKLIDGNAKLKARILTGSKCLFWGFNQEKILNILANDIDAEFYANIHREIPPDEQILDFTNLDRLDSDCFDFIFVDGLLDHSPEIEIFFKLVTRTLRTKGQLLLFADSFRVTKDHSAPQSIGVYDIVNNIPRQSIRFGSQFLVSLGKENGLNFSICDEIEDFSGHKKMVFRFTKASSLIEKPADENPIESDFIARTIVPRGFESAKICFTGENGEVCLATPTELAYRKSFGSDFKTFYQSERGAQIPDCIFKTKSKKWLVFLPPINQINQNDDFENTIQKARVFRYDINFQLETQCELGEGAISNSGLICQTQGAILCSETSRPNMAGAQIWRTTDNAKTWQVVWQPSPRELREVTQLIQVEKSSGYILLCALSDSGVSTIWMTTDGGFNWHKSSHFGRENDNGHMHNLIFKKNQLIWVVSGFGWSIWAVGRINQLNEKRILPHDGGPILGVFHLKDKIIRISVERKNGLARILRISLFNFEDLSEEIATAEVEMDYQWDKEKGRPSLGPFAIKDNNVLVSWPKPNNYDQKSDLVNIDLLKLFPQIIQ